MTQTQTQNPSPALNRKYRRHPELLESQNSAPSLPNVTPPSQNSAPSLSLSESDLMRMIGNSSTPQDLQSLLETNGPKNDIGTSSGSDTPAKKKTNNKFDKLEKDLAEFFGGVAGVVLLMNMQDGLVIGVHAPPLASKLRAVAEKQPAVYKFLVALTTGSIYGALALELAAITGAIMQNHNVKMPWQKKIEAENADSEPDVPTIQD